MSKKYKSFSGQHYDNAKREVMLNILYGSKNFSVNNKVIAERLAYEYWIENKRHLEISILYDGRIYNLTDGDQIIYSVAGGVVGSPGAVLGVK